MKNSIGKPYERKVHVRFDEGGADSLLRIIIFMVNDLEWVIRLYSTGHIHYFANFLSKGFRK